ncbi:MAG TPA: hypothetical protein DCX07_07100 [Phycisphaerales bacterium]|nr:hypothetical protein [Phycisphaerales bacterium]
MNSRMVFRIAACLAAAWLCGGCSIVSNERLNKLEADHKAALETARQVADRNEGLQAEIIAQRKQIETLQALGEKRLQTLFHVERIELGRYTGGADFDSVEGDDGVKVYLRPIDRDGSVIKAAGTVKVQVFDLAADPKNNLVGEYAWDVEKVGKQWSSGFMTYHFSFDCPWKDAPPAHDELTIRVEFTDYLTGRSFTAQQACKVRLVAKPPAATQPAK